MSRSKTGLGRYAGFLFGQVRSSVSGYTRLLPAVLQAAVLMAALFLASLIIALPLWFFSTQFTMVFTIVMLAFLSGSIVFFAIKKLVNARSLRRTMHFTGMLFEFGLIMFLFHNRVFYYVPAVALSVEYIAFIGITMRLPNFYSPWMAITLIACGFAGFMYQTLVIGMDKHPGIAIPLAIVYLFSLGFLANERRKPHEKAGAGNAPG